MSYCRWSSDSFRCDIYAYEHVNGGFMIHVAGNRIPDDAPRAPDLPAPGDTKAIQRYMAEQKAWHDYLKICERRPIGGGCDGQSYCEPDLEHLKARLLILREKGYRFPNYVLSMIDEEMKEGAEQ